MEAYENCFFAEIHVSDNDFGDCDGDGEIWDLFWRGWWSTEFGEPSKQEARMSSMFEWECLLVSGAVY